jgi:hypothetical protein
LTLDYEERPARFLHFSNFAPRFHLLAPAPALWTTTAGTLAPPWSRGDQGGLAGGTEGAVFTSDDGILQKKETMILLFHGSSEQRQQTL